jgi:hypothetical protein
MNLIQSKREREGGNYYTWLPKLPIALGDAVEVADPTDTVTAFGAAEAARVPETVTVTAFCPPGASDAANYQ